MSRRLRARSLAALFVLSLPFGLAACGDGSATSDQAVTPEEARAIAKEAYVYGFPMVDGYRVLYAYFGNPSDPEFRGA